MTNAEIAALARRIKAGDLDAVTEFIERTQSTKDNGRGAVGYLDPLGTWWPSLKCVVDVWAAWEEPKDELLEMADWLRGHGAVITVEGRRTIHRIADLLTQSAADAKELQQWRDAVNFSNEKGPDREGVWLHLAPTGKAHAGRWAFVDRKDCMCDDVGDPRESYKYCCRWGLCPLPIKEA